MKRVLWLYFAPSWRILLVACIRWHILVARKLVLGVRYSIVVVHRILVTHLARVIDSHSSRGDWVAHVLTWVLSVLRMPSNRPKRLPIVVKRRVHVNSLH